MKYIFLKVMNNKKIKMIKNSFKLKYIREYV